MYYILHHIPMSTFALIPLYLDYLFFRGGLGKYKLLGASIQSIPCPLTVINSHYSNVTSVLIFSSMDFDLFIKAKIISTGLH